MDRIPHFSRLRFEAPVSVLRFATRVEADTKRDFYSVTVDRLFCDQPLELFARQPNLEICFTLGFRMLFEPDEALLLCSEFRTSTSADHDRDFFAQIEKLPVFSLAFIDRQPFRVQTVSWGTHEKKST